LRTVRELVLKYRTWYCK